MKIRSSDTNCSGNDNLPDGFCTGYRRYLIIARDIIRNRRGGHEGTNSAQAAVGTSHYETGDNYR